MSARPCNAKRMTKSANRDESIMVLWGAGLTRRRIMLATGVTNEQVRRIVSRARIAGDPRADIPRIDERKCLSASDRVAIAEHRRLGMTARRIAAELGLSRHMVERWVTANDPRQSGEQVAPPGVRLTPGVTLPHIDLSGLDRAIAQADARLAELRGWR